MPGPEIVAIVNPLSGAGATPGIAEQRVALLRARFTAARVSGDVHLTQRSHHAGELARAAVAAGARLVIAWGGDGTINEIGTALARSDVALGIVAAGSGNGFAHEVGVPTLPEAAIDVAIHGRDRQIDAGELEGRLFFNIAGIGFDAVVAQQFNLQTLGRRGMAPYVRIGLRETFRYRGLRYRIRLDDEEIVSDALLIAFANGREYGNHIRLAPHARLDDGKLEAMVVEDRTPLARLWCSRHLALGTADKAPRVIMRSVQSARIEADGDLLYHLDGEIGTAKGSIAVRILPKVLKVRVV